MKTTDDIALFMHVYHNRFCKNCDQQQQFKWTSRLQLWLFNGTQQCRIGQRFGLRDAFILGLKTAAQGGKSALTDAWRNGTLVLTQHKKQSDAKQLIELKKKADANAKIGAEFLAANAKKQGVQTTQSGLQYQILKPGTGPSPKANSIVKVNYEGRLIDGTVFDSSIARNQTAEFQVSQVIQGWTEGLQLMKEGAEYRFFIPAQLGYGQIGSGDVIEPNSTLIFDIELIEILAKPSK